MFASAAAQVVAGGLVLLQLIPATIGATEVIPALSQRVIDVELSPRPSSLAAITILTKPQDTKTAAEQGNIYFSSSQAGHLNTWNLNLTQGGFNESGSQKTLCFNKKSSALEKNKNFVTVVAFSNSNTDENIDIEAKWNT